MNEYAQAMVSSDPAVVACVMGRAERLESALDAARAWAVQHGGDGRVMQKMSRGTLCVEGLIAAQSPGRDWMEHPLVDAGEGFRGYLPEAGSSAQQEMLALRQPLPHIPGLPPWFIVEGTSDRPASETPAVWMDEGQVYMLLSRPPMADQMFPRKAAVWQPVALADAKASLSRTHSRPHVP